MPHERTGRDGISRDTFISLMAAVHTNGKLCKASPLPCFISFSVMPLCTLCVAVKRGGLFFCDLMRSLFHATGVLGPLVGTRVMTPRWVPLCVCVCVCARAHVCVCVRNVKPIHYLSVSFADQ